MIVTSDFSDFISLVFVIFSQGENYSVWSYVLSTIASIAFIFIYIYLIII